MGALPSTAGISSSSCTYSACHCSCSGDSSSTARSDSVEISRSIRSTEFGGSSRSMAAGDGARTACSAKRAEMRSGTSASLVSRTEVTPPAKRFERPRIGSTTTAPPEIRGPTRRAISSVRMSSSQMPSSMRLAILGPSSVMVTQTTWSNWP